MPSPLSQEAQDLFLSLAESFKHFVICYCHFTSSAPQSPTSQSVCGWWAVGGKRTVGQRRGDEIQALFFKTVWFIPFFVFFWLSYLQTLIPGWMREVQGRGTNVVIPHEGTLSQINQNGFMTQLIPPYARQCGQSCNKDGERDGMVATESVPAKPYSRCDESSFAIIWNGRGLPFFWDIFKSKLWTNWDVRGFPMHFSTAASSMKAGADVLCQALQTQLDSPWMLRFECPIPCMCLRL